MPKSLEMHIIVTDGSPRAGRDYGTFTHCDKMPWGPWILTLEPKALFRVGDITVLECFARENVEDEQGCIAQGTIEHDPCFRHFIIGQRTDGEVVWWHFLEQEYDLKNKRFVEGSIALEGKQVIVKGYGGYGGEQGKTVRIDAETGAKSVI